MQSKWGIWEVPPTDDKAKLLEHRSRNAVLGEPMRRKRGIVPLVAELRREAEGDDKFLPKESRH
ncbi:hypothetical protein KSF_001220 [Reticulibacter mediterranei]|uniref:Uncharacterized protein n=1 Tax=Reticulibacter mediterranei TaxID=2778369 RepID=A0A8J3I784_9CHLR|nr:hypothetical protein KSF_001220 [Reticulibacter mediterranei]